MKLYIALDYTHGTKRVTSVSRLNAYGRSVMRVSLEGGDITELCSMDSLKGETKAFVKAARELIESTPSPK
jgi:hypothetical protein